MPTTFEIEQLAPRRAPATLNLEGDDVTFSVAGDERRVTRTGRAERLLVYGVFARSRTAAIVGKPRRYFRLDGEALDALQRWIGPPTKADVRAAARRLLGWPFVLIAIPALLDALPSGQMFDYAIQPHGFNGLAVLRGLLLLAIPLKLLGPDSRHNLLLSGIALSLVNVLAIVEAIRGPTWLWLVLLPALEIWSVLHLMEWKRLAPADD